MKFQSRVQVVRATNHFTNRSGCHQVTLPLQLLDIPEKFLTKELQPLALSKRRRSLGRFSKLLHRLPTKRCPIKTVEHKSRAVDSNRHPKEMRKSQKRNLLRATRLSVGQAMEAAWEALIVTSPTWQTPVVAVNCQSAHLRLRISKLQRKSSLLQQYQGLVLLLELQPRRPRRCLETWARCSTI